MDESEKVDEAKDELDEMSKKEKEEGDDREPYSKRSKDITNDIRYVTNW